MEDNFMELMDLIRTNRTYRRFKQTAVSDEIIAEVLEAARNAASAANRQPLSYVVVKSQKKVEEVFALTKWAGYLPPEQGQPKKGEEPVLFIGVVENTDINKNCDTDAGLAIANMRIAAWAHGVGSCIIGACNKPELSRMFGLTQNQVLHTVIAFGYPSHASSIEDMKNDDVKYYLDGNRNYVVPKRRIDDVVTEI
jgi:FMN reductase [NAD(P)H]